MAIFCGAFEVRVFAIILSLLINIQILLNYIILYICISLLDSYLLLIVILNRSDLFYLDNMLILKRYFYVIFRRIIYEN
jgi:hypothetical protein